MKRIHRTEGRNSYTVMVDFNIPFSILDRLRQINKKREDLNNTIPQLDLKDIQNIHPTAPEYILFSSTQRTFMYHMLVTKQVLTSLRKLNHTKCLFQSQQHKTKVKSPRKPGKLTNMCKLHNTLEWPRGSKKRSQGKLENILRQMKT